MGGGAIERRLLIVAGEASGDRHAARLIGALAGSGSWRVRGITGPALEAAGAERIVPSELLAVVGFTGVLKRLPQIAAAYRRLLREAERFRPHAALLVDTPGFNLRLGPALKRRGVPIFYYIAPQVWAWHPERAAHMSRWVDRLAVVFPFEEPMFRAAGVDTHFVGHPLLEALEPEEPRDAFLAGLKIDRGGGPILGLLPGSRLGELKSHAPVLLEAADLLRRRHPDLVTVLAMAPGLSSRALDAFQLPDHVRVVYDRTHAVQAYSDCCAVASGTATLETALFRTPHVIVFRTGRINFEIARRVVRLRHIGLPNIVAGEPVAPELIQAELTPRRLAETLERWLDDPVEREAQRDRLACVRARLGSPGASRRAAELLRELVK